MAGTGERHNCVPVTDPVLTAEDNVLMTEADGRVLLLMAGIAVVVLPRTDNDVLKRGRPKNVAGYISSPIRMRRR